MDSPSLWALFISAFVSSTLLPGGSEAVLVWLLQEEGGMAWRLWAVATLGNTLGGLTSWGVGWLIARRFPARRLLKAEHLQAVARIRQWGSPLLFFSWLPLLGDPLCVAAGWLRISFAASVLFILLGKAARYALIVWVFV